MLIFKQIPSYFKRFFKRFNQIFSKPQFENFKRLVSGFVLSDRKNIQEINSIYGDKDQSSLNRFVTESDWDMKEANKIRLKAANDILGSKENGIIIFDDTMAIKTGKKMEKANFHRSGVTKKSEWGHCFVDSLYAEVDSDVRYPIAIDSYLRKVDTDKQNLFKTKREIALEQIDFAKECGIKAKTVMADAWYYSSEFVSALKARKLKFFLGIKTNVKFSKGREKRISIEDYIKTLTKKNFIKHTTENGHYFLHTQEISIRGAGKEILLISYKKGDEKNVKCYITNQFGWKNDKYMSFLLKRWSIECLHRDNKQHLGLEKYQVRKYRGMQAVALAVLSAYTLLVLNKLPKILREFRQLKTIGEMCRFAQLVAQKSKYWLNKIFHNKEMGAQILNQLALVKNAKV